MRLYPSLQVNKTNDPIIYDAFAGLRFPLAGFPGYTQLLGGGAKQGQIKVAYTKRVPNYKR